jgi:hypothetical protein
MCVKEIPEKNKKKNFQGTTNHTQPLLALSVT